MRTETDEGVSINAYRRVTRAGTLVSDALVALVRCTFAQLEGKWPLREGLIALACTLVVWGACLSSTVTLSPEAGVDGIHPWCRIATDQLTCQVPRAPALQVDAGAPAWQSIPIDYLLHNFQERGQPRPRWNPYQGSGYPLGIDGLSSSLSPTQWLTAHVPGDQGRDIAIFARQFLWTFGITWLVAQWGASTLLLIAIAFTATLAPYAGNYVDIVFLDVDLLSPWFLLIVMSFATGRLASKPALVLATALGVLAGMLGFQQAQLVLCAAIGVIVLAAAPWTRGRSVLLAVGFGLGVLVVFPTWLPLLRNMDQFVSSRSVQCIAAQPGGGAPAFWAQLFGPNWVPDRFSFATLVGLGVLLSGPPGIRFIGASLVVIGFWNVLGLPHAFCSVPLFSGLRFSRHLVPHLQLLFVVGVGISIAALSRRFHRKSWIVLAAAAVGAFWVLSNSGEGPAAVWVERACILASVLGVAAALLRLARPEFRPLWHPVSRGVYDMSAALFAFTPLLFASAIPLYVLNNGQIGTPQIAPLSGRIDPTTPLGMVRRLSARQDRRHYSPSGFLYPNWASALGILDMLSLTAFYPLGYHELNGGLFKSWYRDPYHGLVPDRFVPVPPSLAMSPEFQRVLAVNRISLLTFVYKAARFAAAPSPYEAGKCVFLARSRQQQTESYVCPEVGRIGYFPSVVGTVESRARAIEQLGQLSTQGVLDTVYLGPEIDLSIGSTTVAHPIPARGRVVSVRRSSDNLSYKLEVEREGVFVVADTYFRGWTATVNGERAGISRANAAFKAVRVPAGHVELSLSFSPVMF